MNKFEFKNLTPFKWFVLENFPFIEADFDALTEWQLFCKIGKEINKIIDSQNIVGEQAENLTNAFNNLKNYVDNYFENLDVQDEVNNKLNEMAESGQLTDIIAQYLKLAGVLAYNTVADMKTATNLENGSIAKTLGFYSYNDCGGAFYKIRTITNTDVVNEMNIIALQNTSLIAELINTDEILNIRQLGAKADGLTDISNIINTFSQNYSLKIPAGIYQVSQNLTIYHDLIGEGFSRQNNISNDKTWLKVDGKIDIVGNTEMKAQHIENLNIYVSDTNTNNIINHSPSTFTLCYDKNISVYNFQGIAINIDVTMSTFATRLVYIDTVTLWAKIRTTSTGIQIAGNVGDLKFNDVEIMYAQSGINNRSTIIVNHAHIWCGEDGTDVDNWWENTRGIQNFDNANFLGSDIYIDSCLIALVLYNNCSIKIDGFYYWEDNSMEGSSKYDASIVWGPNPHAMRNVNINNAYIYTGSRVKYINGVLTNAKLIFDSFDRFKEISSNNSMSKINDNYYEVSTGDISGESYVPVAIISSPTTENGNCEIKITLDGGQNVTLNINNAWDGIYTITGKYHRLYNEYYYKIDGSLIYIYAKTHTPNALLSCEITSKSNCCIPLNLNDLQLINNEELLPPTLSSAEGLTQITITEET